MMKREARMIARATGEEIPDWLTPEEDVVVEGVGDTIVREEPDGTWSVVRQVDGTEPEVDNGFPSEEIAMRLAKTYNEGGRVLVERRVSKEIVSAGIRKGMVAKYGESPVVITDVSGNDVQVMSADGTEQYVDVTQLGDIREAQDPGLAPGMEPTPFFEGAPPVESPAGMMAGEEHEEEERELLERWKRLEEEEEEEELEEEEEELEGLMIGPPVYFVEIEPMPGQRQSPLGASKTAAVYISQEKGEMPDLRIKPSEMIDLYASIGIPLTKEAHHVKIGEVFLVFDDSSGTFRLEEEIVNGQVAPMTAGMSEVEALEVLQNHADLPEAVVTTALVGAKENGSISLGDKLGYLTQADLQLETTPDGTGLVITEDGMDVTLPMDEAEAWKTLQNATSLSETSIQQAIELAMVGHTPRIGNVKISREAPICKKCNQRHWPFQPCPGTKPEKEKPTEKAEERAEEKEAVQVTGREAPTCKKCGKRHWPFQPCSGGKSDEKKDLEKSEEPATTAEEKEARRVTAQPPFGPPQPPGLGPPGAPAYDEMSGEIPGEFMPEEEWAAIEQFSYETDDQDRVIAYIGGDDRRIALTDSGWQYEDTGEEAQPPPVEVLPPAGISIGRKTAGRVRMYFDWDEFYSSVMPQLSNGQFQSAFAEIASSPPEATASQEEKDLHDEELLLLSREASRRKLPNVSKLQYTIGSIAALADEPDVVGKVAEYRGTDDDDVSYLLNMSTGHQVWFKDAELKPTTNPDTTTVPWPERTKRIVDPENKRQDAEFKQDLSRKVGQAEGEYTYTDTDLEDAAMTAVEEAIPKDLIASAAEGIESDTDPFDVAYNLVQDHKEALLASGRRLLPDMAEDSLDEEAFAHYARNVVMWDLPKPSEAYYAEGMEVGLGAKLKANYKTDVEELQQLRDLGIVGRIVELNEKEAAVAFGDNILLIGQSGLEVVGDFFRECTIRKCQPGDKDSSKPADEQVWCLFAKSTGKVLGRHPSEKDAREQEKAIKAQGVRVAQDLTPLFVDYMSDLVSAYTEVTGEDAPARDALQAIIADEALAGQIGKLFGKDAGQIAFLAEDCLNLPEEYLGGGTVERQREDFTGPGYQPAAAASLRRVAPGPFGGEPGTIGEPAPKGDSISAPPGAPSRGREKTPGPQEVCVCPISGKEIPKQAGVPCSTMESPGHPGVKLVAKPQGPPPSPGKKPGPAASIETSARVTAGRFIDEYASCIIKRVQSGTLTPADALKEINATAKEWEWSAKEKKYVKQRLEGKDPTLPETWALAVARPFEKGRAPAQDLISGGGVKARDVRTAQSDIATLLKELERGEAQSIIRSLDATMDVSNALEGLGWGDDTTDLRQWLIDAPGMTEDILRMYAGDPESANRLVALRAMAERFPQADVSAWLQDDFPFIAEKAQELASGTPAAEALPPPVPQVPPATQTPPATQVPPVPEGVPQTAAERKMEALPGSSPPEFPKNSDSPSGEETTRTAAYGPPTQLMLTYDTPNEQFVLYDMNFGLVSSSGSKEKQIRGQLKAFGIDDTRIGEALKDAKDNIVYIVASKREAQQDVSQYVEDAVQSAIAELSAAAPRANITMTATNKFAELTAGLGVDPEAFAGAIKEVIDRELANYPRPEIPGTKQEFMQIADSDARIGRTYDEKEKKQHIDDLGKHGIPLKETFEKEPPEDIPPGRRLSTAESRNGFTVGDRVRDTALQELIGTVDGFGTGLTIRVAMDVSSYCPDGGVGLYLPDGLINLGPSK